MKETYQPLASLFLAPKEFRSKFPNINSLVSNSKLIDGKFDLDPPKSSSEFDLSIYLMRLLAKNQIDFIKKIHKRDLLLKFEEKRQKAELVIKEANKKRGRPKIRKTLEKEILDIKNLFGNLKKNFDYREIIGKIDNCLAKKIRNIDSNEINLLGKRIVRNESEIFDNTPIKKMKDASVNNVQEMIDFGIGIPEFLAEDDVNSDSRSLDFFTHDISIQADMDNTNMEDFLNN